MIIRYNLKFPFMQLIGTVILAIVFMMNYSLNAEFVHVLQHTPPVSRYVGAIPPAGALLIGLLIGFGLYTLPLVAASTRKRIKRWSIVVVVVYLFARPIAALIVDTALVATAFINTAIDVGSILLLAIYSAPMIFGVYGLWSRKFSFTAVAAFFILLVAFATNNPLSELPPLVIFALLLFGYIELGHSVSRFHALSQDLVPSDRFPIHAEAFNSLLNRYLFTFTIYLAVLGVLVAVIFNLPAILIRLGEAKLGESLELGSIHGTVMTLFYFLLLIVAAGLIRRFLRREFSFERWLRAQWRKLREVRGEGEELRAKGEG